MSVSARARRLVPAVALLTALSACPATATLLVGSAASPSTPAVELEVQIDDVAGEARFVFRGPADRWFAWGFGAVTMSGYSIIIEQPGPVTVHERILAAIGNPGVPQPQQDLTVVGVVTNAGVTEVTVTRPLDTGDRDDYVFPGEGGVVDLIWARGTASSLELAYHGIQNKGVGEAMVLQAAPPTGAESVESRSWGTVKMMFRRLEGD